MKKISTALVYLQPLTVAHPQNPRNLARRITRIGVIGALVSACTLALPSAHAESPQSAFSERRTNGSSPCAVTVVQNGAPLHPTKAGRIDAYLLDAAPFTLEVPSADCQASVGAVRHATDLMQIAGSRYVLSSPAFYMASDIRNQDVLILRVEDPRLPDEFSDLFVPNRQAYEAVCAQLGECPHLIRATRSYWAFAKDESGTPRAFAHFKRLTHNRALKDVVVQTVSIVVYTRVMEIPDANGSASALNVMEAHPMWLQFLAKQSGANQSRADLGGATAVQR